MNRLVAILAAMAGLSEAALAHEARPLSIVATEIGGGHVILTWRAPPTIDPANAPEVTLAATCAPAIGISAPAGQLSGRADYRCNPGLEGAQVAIRYPSFNPSISSLVRIVRASGQVSTAVLGPEIRVWTAPAPESFEGVARGYLALGVKHILIGLDHILFLAGLLILARTARRALVTVTGFTIAHSITLALVALEVVRVSVPAVEAVIALSIVFVAAEIARGDRRTLAWRRPVIVASAFGLLHGAGFAAVLGEIGLPQTEKLTALLFFNVGVEAGQLLLVAAAFAGAWLWRQARARAKSADAVLPPMPAERIAGYALGVVSAYWFFERVAAVFA